MKFIHLGDLHIGKLVNDFNMIDDQRFILNQILTIIENQKIDAALLAGDIYDKTIPTEEAVMLFDEFLNELVKRKIKTFIISGNHDSDERLNFGSSLFKNNDIYISAIYNGNLFKYELEDEYGKINVYLMPFIKGSQVKRYFPEENIENYDKAIRVVLKNTKIDLAERNILVAHQFVAGKTGLPETAGSENIDVLNVGTVDQIGVDCFYDFDYVALGHIHSPQKIERDTIRYSGSVLKYSLKEINNHKSVPVITLNKKGDVNVELIELKPRREMRHLKGELKQLLSEENIIYPDDYIYVTLTDEVIENNVINIVRDKYQNLMKLDFDNSHTRNIEQFDLKMVSQDKTFEEIIKEFYKMQYNNDMSEDELEIMLDVAREAGVIE